jgi:GNAT superfamily N-acetyltransferase
MDEFRIERYDRTLHQRDEFRCGKPSLDEFLHKLVGQYEKRKLGTTFVLVRSDSARVLGYYTLASSSLSFEHAPPKLAKKLPRHPIPTVLLARLAVDQTVHGQGHGSDLLLDAFHRIARLSQTLGIHAVEVDALDADAQRFYERFGFVPLLDRERHLVLPLATIEKVIGKASEPEA